MGQKVQKSKKISPAIFMYLKKSCTVPHHSYIIPLDRFQEIVGEIELLLAVRQNYTSLDVSSHSGSGVLRYLIKRATFEILINFKPHQEVTQKKYPKHSNYCNIFSLFPCE